MKRDEVMVLGATGLVGRHTVRELSTQGHKVIALARNPPATSDSSVQWIRTDVTNEADLDVLPHCAKAISTLAIWMTADVAPKLAERGLNRLVAFSSSSAETKADAPEEAERALAARLTDGEERVQTLSPGLQSTILRPTMIYGGHGDANVERIAGQLVRFRAFPVVGKGNGLRQPVHAEDLGVGAVRALFSPGTEDRVYAVAGGEVLTVRQMVARVGTANGVKARFVPVPRRPAEWGLRLLGELPKFRQVSPGALERMSKDLVFDNSAAIADFDYAPRTFAPPDYRLSC